MQSPNGQRCREGPRATPHRPLVTRQTLAELLAVLSFGRRLAAKDDDGSSFDSPLAVLHAHGVHKGSFRARTALSGRPSLLYYRKSSFILCRKIL